MSTQLQSRGARTFLQTFALVHAFSLRALLRRKAAWLGILLFAACLLILYPFAFGTESLRSPEIRLGAFWTISEFVVALVVSRMFSTEQEAGALEFLLASRAPRAGILCGKIFFTALEILSLQLPMLLVWSLFYNLGAELFPLLATLLPVCVCFALATASIGALVFCITYRSLAREILVPVLFYPLQIAILLAAVTLCLDRAKGEVVGTLSNDAWWALLALTPVVFTTLGMMLADHLFEE